MEYVGETNYFIPPTPPVARLICTPNSHIATFYNNVHIRVGELVYIVKKSLQNMLLHPVRRFNYCTITCSLPCQTKFFSIVALTHLQLLLLTNQTSRHPVNEDDVVRGKQSRA